MVEETTHRRGEQPRCTRVENPGTASERRCNHARSLHGKERGACKAMGCWCPSFVDHEELADAL